jgi:fucose permease
VFERPLLHVAQMTDQPRPHRSISLLLIAYLGFISLGLPDAVAAVAWPSLRDEFALHQSSFGWLFVASGGGYFLSSFFAGWLSQRLGVGLLLTVSSLLVGIAMLGDSRAGVWFLFVACGVLWGLGSGAIDAALNGFVASHFPAKHVSWLHACYSTGAAVGPLLMTFCLAEFGSWRPGYAIVGGSMLAMTMLFLATRAKWSGGAESEQHESPVGVSLLSVLQQRLVWMQIAVFFCYTGLENTAGQWTYTLLTEERDVAKPVAGTLVGCYYGSIAVGRLVIGPFAERIGLDPLLRMATVVVVAGAFLLASGPLELAAIGLVLLGLGLAPIFPTLMTRTPQRLGPAHAAHAIGFQVSAAMMGAAILPSLTGMLAEHWGLWWIGLCDAATALALFTLHELLLGFDRVKRPTVFWAEP